MAQIDNVDEGSKLTNAEIGRTVMKYINEGMKPPQYQGCLEGTGFSKGESKELNVWAKEEFKNEPNKARRHALESASNVCDNKRVAAVYEESKFEMSCQAGKSEEVTNKFMD